MRLASSRAKSGTNNNAWAFCPLPTLHLTIEWVCLQRSLFSFHFPFGHSKCRLRPWQFPSTLCGPPRKSSKQASLTTTIRPLRSLLPLAGAKMSDSPAAVLLVRRTEIHHHVHTEAVLPPACSQLTNHNRDIKARPSQEDRRPLDRPPQRPKILPPNFLSFSHSLRSDQALGLLSLPCVLINISSSQSLVCPTQPEVHS